MTRLADILKLVAVVATMALGSCVTNVGPELPQDEPIAYQAVVGLTSEGRAILSGTSYPTTLPFAAFAAQLNEGQTWAANKANATTLINGDQVVYNTYYPGAWTTQQAYYWPLKGSLSFFAYSPWDDAQGNKINNIAFTPTTGELKVTGWDVTATKYKDVDLMIADPKYDQTEAISASGVPTVFRHKLAQLSFRAGLAGEYKEGGTTYEIWLRKVTLKNVYTSGNYSSTENSGRWTNLGGKENVVIYQDATGVKLSHLSATTLGSNMLMMPQGHEDSASSATLEIVYYDTKSGNVESVDIILRHLFPDSNWIINSHYTYSIMIDRGDPDYIEFNPPTVAGDWVDGGTYELTIQ